MSMEAVAAKKVCSSKSCNKGKGKKVKRKDDLLPLDLLEYIYRKLDAGDLFRFAGVCKSWRIIHHNLYWKTNFMESQSPFIVVKRKYAQRRCSFYSIPGLKIYNSVLPNFWGLSYCGSSSGYLIFGMGDGAKSKFLLVNPFTRREKQISTPPNGGNCCYHLWWCRVLLAFVKGSDSEEFVVAVSTYYDPCGLNVYQSRNSSWVTYSTMTDPWNVMDFAVLHNTIYALTNKAKIGILSLNSTRVKFLDFKNTPHVASTNLRLVNCDGQLLVVHFEPKKTLNVYKVDFSAMEYVKLESLGDIALFYAEWTDCYALSNPGRWGYDSNSVYNVSCHDQCEVYSWNNELKKRIEPDHFRAPTPTRGWTTWLGWCFPNLHNEVDYSVVD